MLQRLKAKGAFVDCYMVDVPGQRTQADFVEALYTTRLFKLERLLIRVLAFKPSSDHEARELALGHRDTFAVWKVESRSPDQLLLADQTGRTRSWLMTEPPSAGRTTTRLLFGSAVIPRTDKRSGEQRFGLLFKLLLGFHGAYSVALLRAAAVRLSAVKVNHPLQS